MFIFKESSDDENDSQEASEYQGIRPSQSTGIKKTSIQENTFLAYTNLYVASRYNPGKIGKLPSASVEY